MRFEPVIIKLQDPKVLDPSARISNKSHGRWLSEGNSVSLVKMLMMVAMLSHYDAGADFELPTLNAPPVQELGLASWYGDGAWHGEVTANGEVFDPAEFTCAHRTLPFDTVVLVLNRANRKRVWCRINDRGPYGARLPDGSWQLRTDSQAEGNWRGLIDM